MATPLEACMGLPGINSHLQLVFAGWYRRSPYARPMEAYEGVYINQQNLELSNILKGLSIAPMGLFILVMPFLIYESKRAPEGFLWAPMEPYRVVSNPLYV